MNIAEKLRKLREDKGISQNKLIEELEEKQNVNVAISSIRNYENTKAPRIPQGDVLLALARYYDVTLEYLIDDELNNRKHETIEISKVFNFSDKAIENLKEISKMKDTSLREKTNNLLEDINKLIKVLVTIDVWEEV